MKVEEAHDERRPGGCERMAEAMETFCGSEGGAIDCHSFMQRMMGAGRKEEKPRKENQGREGMGTGNSVVGE